jgi:hypothetical protein
MALGANFQAMIRAGIVAPSLYTNSAAEVQQAVWNIPANFLQAGQSFRVKWQGIQTASAGVITLQQLLRLGTTTLTGTQVIAGTATAGAVSNVFSGEFIFTVRAGPGAAVAIVGHGRYFEPQLIALAVEKRVILATTNFATNGALVCELNLKYSAANASESARVDCFTID